MKKHYYKSTENLKKTIDTISKEVFKGFVDTENYFKSIDPKTGKEFVVIIGTAPSET
jgi:GH15 family glucan-1,4-alpha-glucosidase